MTNLTVNFDQIKTYAQSYGLPVAKKRAILREFLQVKIISLIYSQKSAKNLFFVGGTSLRLLYNLDRFSEDLDFDSSGIKRQEIKKLLELIADFLERENIDLNFYQNSKEEKDHYEFRFPNVLFETGISSNREEKLAIKFDFESNWKDQKREVAVLNRYGFLTSVVTKSLDQFVVEKLVAYVNRAQTQPRDLYDLVWLCAQGAKPDDKFAKMNGYEIKNLISHARGRFSKEKLSVLKSRLVPFLLDETAVTKISFFDQLYK